MSAAGARPGDYGNCSRPHRKSAGCPPRTCKVSDMFQAQVFEKRTWSTLSGLSGQSPWHVLSCPLFARQRHVGHQALTFLLVLTGARNLYASAAGGSHTVLKRGLGPPRVDRELSSKSSPTDQVLFDSSPLGLWVKGERETAAPPRPDVKHKEGLREMRGTCSLPEVDF